MNEAILIARAKWARFRRQKSRTYALAGGGLGAALVVAGAVSQAYGTKPLLLTVLAGALAIAAGAGLFGQAKER